MAYRALYREWRPQSFADMVGQEHVTKTLQNALSTHRFAHAYLFSGPRGTGKTSAAKILAKAINCEQGPKPEPCNQCAACRGITEGSIMDVVEIDAASNRGVDEIRDLRERVRYAPTEVRYKVFIIDEVHMLTTEAFNALLKTLEEPPAHVMFILATTEPHKLPATILSRCQRFDFRRITGTQVVERLRLIAKEMDVHVEEEALWLVSRAAEGGMRDALSIFDQAIAFGGTSVSLDDITLLLGGISNEVIGDLAEAIAHKNMQEGLRIISKLIDAGKDVSQLLHDLLLYYRDLLMFKTIPDLQEVQERVHYDQRFAEIAELYDSSALVALLSVMTETQNHMKWQTNGRLLLEMMIVRLCSTESADVSGLLKRIEDLEKKLEKGIVTASIAGQSEVQDERKESPFAAKPVSHRQTKPATTRTATHTTRGVPPNPEDSKTVKIPFDQFIQWLQREDREKCNMLVQQWPRILGFVKDVKIQTHAWLLDGEPVAVAQGRVIVAFRNQIHRETVMKSIHKDIIDQVLTRVLGEPFQLVAILQHEWKQIREMGLHDADGKDRVPEKQSPAEEQWVDEVIQIFGEEVVKIKK